MENSKIGKKVVFEQRLINKSLNTLLGIVGGIVCDNQLTDIEIHFLSTWMSENNHIAAIYPANIIFRRVREVLIDGVVTSEEREQLLKELKILSGNDFFNTGSALPEHIANIFDDDPTVVFDQNIFVLTGEFLFGTRSYCHKAIQSRGGVVSESVTKKTNYLIVGSRSSPDWIVENFGRKIQKAAEMLESGDYEISIIHEVDWAMAL
jgi:hypothetical protein